MLNARLGLGLAAIGRPSYITVGRADDLPVDRSPATLEVRTHQLLDAASALGVDYVDVARSYGRAEEFLSSWLNASGATPFVASKWGYRYTADWRPDAVEHEVKEHSLPMFERQIAETTTLLGPWLRLYQVHSLTGESPLWTDHLLLRRLCRARTDDGVELGFSTSGPAQSEAIRRGMELTVDGVALFSSVQSTWNLLEPSAGGALAEAHASGMRVVVKEALANGRLTERAVSPDSALNEAAAVHGVGIDAVALAAALAQPWCDVVLSGAVTVAQLHSNAAARGLAGELDAVGLVPQEPAETYWARRSSSAWT